MELSHGPSAGTIESALRKRAIEAFGQAADGAFPVSAIETHLADVSYHITTTYSTEVSTTFSPGAAGERNSWEDMTQAVRGRSQELMSSPAHTFRDLTYQYLRTTPKAVTHPSSFVLKNDSVCYSCIEACSNCGGQGKEDCHRCKGRGRVQCSTCSGYTKVNCSRCINGYVGGPGHCSTCGGSGRYNGNTCHGCGGRGMIGFPCHDCSRTGQVMCGSCSGSGTERCRSCEKGKVTCGTCEGFCELTHVAQLKVLVQTSINYKWTGAPAWMSTALKSAMENEALFPTVFSAKTLLQASDDPALFVGKGKALGSSAEVSYRGKASTCHFLGTQADPVYLGGLLSGNFDSVLDDLQNPKNLRRVKTASSGPIAATLIKEVEKGRQEASLSTPVRKGVIAPQQANAFIEQRNLVREHLNSHFGKFMPRAVLQQALKVTVWLMLFVAVTCLLGSPDPAPYVGVGALFDNPGDVFRTLFKHYDEAWNHGGIEMWLFLIASYFFGAFTVQRIWPKTYNRLLDSLLRIPFLTLAGSLVLTVHLALSPFTHFSFNPGVWSLPSLDDIFWSLALPLVAAPQLLITALIYSACKYKAASADWVHRQKSQLAMY